MSRIVVVGAGVSGMAAAFLLCEAGHEVTVLERENVVGGLARTFRYGEYSFDVGPHRFHTDDLTVISFLHRTLGNNWTEIDRKSGVWMYGKYHDWPLRPSSLLKLPFPVMFRTGLDLFKRRSQEKDSFKGYILSMYGRTLYQLFFGPYTRKFTREDPELIHSDWAVSGIDRAVIDKRVQMNTLSQVIKGALLPRAVRTKFIYPASGGIGHFCFALQKKMEGMGGRVLIGSRVVAVSTSSGLIDSVRTEKGDSFQLDLLIWTAPIGDIVEMLGLPRTWLSFISTVCYNYTLDTPPRIPYQWCYYGQEGVVFNRLAIPSLFSRASAPSGKCGVCAEVTCIEGDRIWEEPEKLSGQVQRHLENVGVIASSEQIDGLRIERIPNTYPVYKLGYREELARVKQELGCLSNLELLGRTGTFWYNNMDHSIRMALDLVDRLKGGGKSEG